MGRDLFLIFFGAALGFGFTYLTEWRRRYHDRKDRAYHSKQIAMDVSFEAKQGINRCFNLAKGISKKPKSFSLGKIYTAFWDSVKNELARDLEDREALKLLHRIYHRFELVNFNMDKNRLGAGAAFADTHLQEMVDDLESLSTRFSTWKCQGKQRDR